jgi:hypothetical protein
MSDLYEEGYRYGLEGWEPLDDENGDFLEGVDKDEWLDGFRAGQAIRIERNQTMDEEDWA